MRSLKARSVFRAEIHKLQLELYSANQRLINDAVEGYTDELRRYEARYRRTVRGVKGPISFDALVAKTRSARAILVGDYHTLSQAQRVFFRILRRQHAEKRLVVALEMLPGQSDELIARFLSGELSEDAFLRKIDHYRRWPFGALDAVRPVLDLCCE